MNNRQIKTGIILMAATAFLWSIAGLIIKVIDWNPFVIAGLRSFIASIVLLVYLRRPGFTFSFPQISAAIANAATMLLFVTANKTTTAANAILLQYIAPVLTAFIGAVLLKEKTRVEHWIALAIAAAGMIIMFSGKIGAGGNLGNMLAVASAFTFSLFFIFMRMQKNESPFESVLLSHWITAAVCLVISLTLPSPVFTVRSAVAIIILGIVQIGIPSILFSIAIKRITALSANLIAIIEPAFNPVWVFLVLGESPGINTIIGGAMIVFAVTAASVISSRRNSS